MRIILDCDGVLSDTDNAVIEYYREKTGDCSTSLDNIVHWRLDEVCPLWSKEEVDDIFTEPRLFKLMKPFENARKYVEKWQEKHEVIVCTIHRAEGMLLKDNWIKKHFPTLKDIVILNNIGMDKSMMYGDVLVDDSLHNIQTAVTNYKVCFGRPHANKSWNGRTAFDWEELDRQISQIEKIEEE